NDSSYRLRDADSGSRVRVLVTVTGAGATGSTSAASPVSPVVLGPPPLNIERPSISGAGVVGAPLTASPGVWSGSPSSLSFRWLRCDTDEGCALIGGPKAGVYSPS